MHPFSALSLVAFLASTTLAVPTGGAPATPGVPVSPPNAPVDHAILNQGNVHDNANVDINQNLNGFSPNPFNGQLQIITVQQQVCERVEVSIVQKRVAIFKELIKKTIVEQRCTVETAVIIVQNFQNDFNHWVQNIHQGHAGFDQDIANLGENVFQNQDQAVQDQQIRDSDIVWRGQDIVRGDVQVPADLVGNGTNIVDDNSANVTAGVGANATASITDAGAVVNATDSATGTVAIATPTDVQGGAEATAAAADAGQNEGPVEPDTAAGPGAPTARGLGRK